MKSKTRMKALALLLGLSPVPLLGFLWQEGILSGYTCEIDLPNSQYVMSPPDNNTYLLKAQGKAGVLIGIDQNSKGYFELDNVTFGDVDKQKRWRDFNSNGEYRARETSKYTQEDIDAFRFVEDKNRVISFNFPVGQWVKFTTTKFPPSLNENGQSPGNIVKTPDFRLFARGAGAKIELTKFGWIDQLPSYQREKCPD